MKKGHYLGILFFILLAIMASELVFSLPAFSSSWWYRGAEGFGSANIGGRGGRVIKVTTLNATGPGSFADAAAQSGSRIIVFDVSGVINGDINIKDSYVTIAGQTARGAGITINGKLIIDDGLHDIVIRFLRIRPANLQQTDGAIIRMRNCNNIIIDHVSIAWAYDEGIDISGTTNLTVQWSTLEEGSITGNPDQWDTNNLGVISDHNCDRITVHHSLVAHNKYRAPLLELLKTSDLRNNVGYNLFIGHDSALGDTDTGSVYVNAIGNSYKDGPNSFIEGKGDPNSPSLLRGGHYYSKNTSINGQFFDSITDAYKYLFGVASFDLALKIMQGDIVIPSSPANTPFVITDTATWASSIVLNRSGCFPRDVVTERTIQEVKQGTGSWGKHVPQDLMEGLMPTASQKDSDNDGIPDYWESSHGLNKTNPSDANQLNALGYTRIEEYLNELADSIVEAQSSTCIQQSGIICSQTQDCSSYWLTADDTSYCCSGVCTQQFHPADTNQNNIIEMKELIAFIARWKLGQANINDVMSALDRWFRGS